MSWEHDALAADLAQHLRSDKRMVWTDMQLGPSGSARPDVYTLERSFSRPLPTAYEIKVSRADFRSDTTSGKWQKYLAYAGAVIFAVPDGLINPNELPATCGLIVRKAQTWRNIRKATRSQLALPMDACMKLLIDGVNRTVQRSMPVPRKADLWREHEAVRKKFGDAVARAARDIAAAQSEAADLQAQRRAGRERVEREVAAHRAHLMEQAGEYERVRRELIEWLGLPEGSNTFTIRRRIGELKAACDADVRVREADSKLSRARHSLSSTLATLEPLVEDMGLPPLKALGQ